MEAVTIARVLRYDAIRIYTTLKVGLAAIEPSCRFVSILFYIIFPSACKTSAYRLLLYPYPRSDEVVYDLIGRRFADGSFIREEGFETLL